MKPPAWITILLLALAVPVSTHAVEWRLRHPSPTPEALGKATRFNGRYFIAGGTATNLLLVSTNGTNWVEGPLVPQARGLSALIVAGGDLLAGGRNGIFSSPDGTNWTLRHSLNDPISTGIAEFAYGNGRHVAVGDFPGVLLSSDGVTWSNSFNGTSPHRALDITFGQGRFVAADSSTLRHSTDGAAWTSVDGVSLGQTPSLAFGSNYFVAAGDGWFHHSPDGVNWTRSESMMYGSRSTAYGNGRYVVVGNGGAGWHSTNGSNWITMQTGADPLWHVTYVDDRFVATGPRGRVVTSLTGTNWTAHSDLIGPYSLSRIAFVNERLIAAGSLGTILVSTNGSSWAEGNLFGNTTFRSVAYGNGRYLAAGDAQTYASTDATNWTHLPGQDFSFRGLAFGSGVFVAVGDNGAIASSFFGTNWLFHNSSSFYTFFDVVFGSGKFVAVGNTGRIMTSVNGTNWSNRSSPQGTHWVSVAHDGTRYAALGRFGELTWSQDGTNWVTAITPAMICTAIGGGAGVFVAADEYRRLFMSRDLSSWEPAWPRTSFAFRSVAFANGRFDAVGDAGQIWESDPIINLVPLTNAGQFSVFGPPGQTGTVQRTTALGATNWQTLGNIGFSNGPVLFSDTMPTEPAAFYRVVLPGQ